jgi:hypothetical protein
MVLVTQLTAILHAGSRLTCHSFLKVRLYFGRLSRPGKSLLSSESVILLVYSLCTEAIEVVKLLATLSASSPTVTSNFFLNCTLAVNSPYVTSSLMRGWVCHLQLLPILASAVILRSKSSGIHNHILLSQIRDSPQPGGPGPCIYMLQKQGGPVIPSGTEFTDQLLGACTQNSTSYNPYTDCTENTASKNSCIAE